MEIVVGRVGRGEQRVPVVALQAQVHRLGRGGATGDGRHFCRDGGKFGELFLQPFDHHLAVVIRVPDRAGVGNEPQKLVVDRVGGAILESCDLDLNLSDGIAGSGGAARVLVQPAFTGEGERILHAGDGQYDLLDPLHHLVLFLDREVAAPAHIHDGLLRRGIGEEVHAVVVAPVIHADPGDQRDHESDGDQRHDRVANDGVDDHAEARAAIGAGRLFRFALRLGRVEQHGRKQGGQNEHHATGDHRGGPVERVVACAEQIVRVGDLHGRDEKQAEGRQHQQRAHDPGQGAQPVRGTLQRARQTARDAAHDRQVNQRDQQRGGQNVDQRARQHPHELARDTGPEQHRKKGAKRRGGGRDDRPEHPLGRFRIGRHRPHAFGNALVGIFDDHDGPIDQHPDGKDQAEHDDVVDRDAEHREQREGEQERCRDREAHKQGRAHTQ